MCNTKYILAQNNHNLLIIKLVINPIHSDKSVGHYKNKAHLQLLAHWLLQHLHWLSYLRLIQLLVHYYQFADAPHHLVYTQQLTVND